MISESKINPTKKIIFHKIYSKRKQIITPRTKPQEKISSNKRYTKYLYIFRFELSLEHELLQHFPLEALWELEPNEYRTISLMNLEDQFDVAIVI